jgi:hypothetical protein
MEEEEDEKQFQNRIQRMYGFDDVETISSVSSRRSSIDEKTPPSTQQPSPTMLQTIDNYKPKQQITIREFYPRKEIPSVMVHRSSSPSISSQQTNDNYEYEQLLQNHPELYNDPNPEIIRKPNPEQVTYKQNVFVRYLVPPTPPPPGPLIIRGEEFFKQKNHVILFQTFRNSSSASTVTSTIDNQAARSIASYTTSSYSS